jgi:esterase/lipase
MTFSQISQPVFIAQGGRDIAVNPGRTRKFFEAIKSVEKEVHFFPQAFHSILNDPDAPSVRRRLMNWLNKTGLITTQENVIPFYRSR